MVVSEGSGEGGEGGGEGGGIGGGGSGGGEYGCSHGVHMAQRAVELTTFVHFKSGLVFFGNWRVICTLDGWSYGCTLWYRCTMQYS